MFRTREIIFAITLVGCANSIGEEPLQVFQETKTEDYIIIDTTLFNSTEATLEMADEAMSKREAEEANTERKMLSLKQLVSQEEELIAELERKLTSKDSIIGDKEKELESLLEKLESVQYQVENTEEIIQRYIISYNALLEENNLLQTELDETYSHIEYLDSLVLTNKKLTKIYESN